eukprot:COSAG04_NODE_229_length_19247_cov_7.166910_14_plen_540_part_00
MGTVRDHRSRHLLGFFYPTDVPSDWGPTCTPLIFHRAVCVPVHRVACAGVVPGSHIPAINRVNELGEHALSSEQGFDLGEPEGSVPAPVGEMGPQDIKRVEDVRTLLGDDSLEERKLICKAGTLILAHHDLIHRGSRRLPGVWRPLFVLRNSVRVSEPRLGAGAFATSPSTPPSTSALLGSGRSENIQQLYRGLHDYLRGDEERIADASATQTVDDLEAMIRSSACDLERLGAAYALGRHPAGLGPLLSMLTDAEERVRRAASYGLTVAPAAAAAAIELLRSPPTVAAPRGLLASNVDIQAALLPNLAHIIGQLSAETAKLGVDAVEILHGAMGRARMEISEFAAAQTPEEAAEVAALEGPLRFHVIERRRLLTECSTALGLVGQAAVHAGDAAVGVAAAEALVEAARNQAGMRGVAEGQPEAGSEFHSFMMTTTATMAAATSLVRLTSSADCWASLPKRHGSPDTNGVMRGASSMDDEFAQELQKGIVFEAIDRGRACSAAAEASGCGSAGARRAVQAVLESADWGWELPTESAYLHL